MSPLRYGFEPKTTRPSAARLCVIGAFAVAITGCAANKEPSYVNGPALRQQAAATTKVEMEDDGVAVQSPPARTLHPAEDDPTQPWSPNYGKSPGQITPLPSKPAMDDEKRLPKQIDAALRPSFASIAGGLRSMNDDEIEAIQKTAIAAHEMRNR